MVGDEGLDLPNSRPETSLLSTSCQRKISLRTATGSSHPYLSAERVVRSSPSRTEIILPLKNAPQIVRRFLMVGDEGLEPPTLSV